MPRDITVHHIAFYAVAALTLLACTPPDTAPPSTTRQAPLREAPVTLPGQTLLDAAPDGRALYGKLSPSLPNSDAGLSYTLTLRDARGKLRPIPGAVTQAALHPTRSDVLYLATTAGPLVRLNLASDTRQTLHAGPDILGLATQGDRLAFTAGVAPDFDLFVTDSGASPERWTPKAAPRWQPFFFADGAVGFVTQEFGRPSVVSMAGPGYVPKVWAHEPEVFPSRAPAPRFQEGRLLFTHARGVAAFDAEGVLVWRKDGASITPGAQGPRILDRAGQEVRP